MEMSAAVAKTGIDPEANVLASTLEEAKVIRTSVTDSEEEPTWWTKNCGPETTAFKVRTTIQEVIMGIFTTLALIFLIVCILAGKAALPGNPVLLLIVFFLGVYLLALNEGLQIAILQGNKLKLSPSMRFLPSFHEASRCLELVEGERLQWWLAGRQFFVICSVFVVAQCTTFNDMTYWPWRAEFWNNSVTVATTVGPVLTTLGSNETLTTLGSNETTVTVTTVTTAAMATIPEGGIPEWFRIAVLQTGVLGALVVVIIGQLVPQLVAVPCPILFFSLPGSYYILKIGLFFHTIGITYIAFLLTWIVRCCLKPKVAVKPSRDTLICNIFDPIRYIGSTAVFLASIFLMVYGIGLEFAALPGAWWLHAILLVLMMITLAYLEGLQVALIDAKKCVEKLSPCALQTFNLTRTDEAMGRFLCGRQILVIFSVYLSSQLTAFDDFKKWPFTDVDVPDWFYVGVAKTGLPAIIVVCAVSQLLPQLVAVSHPQTVLRAPAAIVWTGFALTVEFIGLARAAALASRAIRCCLPENYMIPYNREVEEMLRAAFDDVQEGAPAREFADGTKVAFDSATGEGTIEWAGSVPKEKVTKWQISK